MQVAIVGLGRMGKNIALHLLEQGVSVIAYNRSREDVDEVVAKGAIGAYKLEDIPKLWNEDKPIVAILYVPALSRRSPGSTGTKEDGSPVDQVLFGGHQIDGSTKTGLVNILPKGSIIIDGGNSFFRDSIRRYENIKQKGLHFLDMGTSGGLEGARNGACLMVGGDEDIYRKVSGILEKIACKDGYGYFGPSGAGHFVKMIHNAVEYGMMGALAEGLGLISNYKFQISNEKGNINTFQFDLAKVTKVWAHGSIVSGHLMNMAEKAFAKDPKLDNIEGIVPRGETEAEMEWIETTGIANPVIQTARKQRVETRSKPSFIGKVIAALRREFGGHAVKEKK